MLPDRFCQLLTAFVDGELGKRQRKTVLRLLRKSAEARSFLKQLQDNARKVNELPAQTLGPDFPRVVLHKIAELQPRTLPLRRASGGGLSAWLAGVAAAMILAMVTGVSYWFFSSNKDTAESGPVIALKPEIELAPLKKHHPTNHSPQVAKIPQGKVVSLSKAGIRLAVLDLAHEKTHARLTKELKTQNAVHLELVCKNSTLAVAGLHQVLQNNGVKVLVDAKVQGQLKKVAKTEILVYAENLRPEELANILQQIGAREQNQNAGQRQFNTIHVKTLTVDHRLQLARLFGVDAKQLQPPPPGELGTFIQALPLAGKKKNGANSFQPPPHDRKIRPGDGQCTGTKPRLFGGTANVLAKPSPRRPATGHLASSVGRSP